MEEVGVKEAKERFGVVVRLRIVKDILSEPGKQVK